MFDPTIYENLKVVIEGDVYDRDLAGEISIISREDIVNLATMSRYYSITFQSVNSPKPYSATIKLEAAAKDLYGEILERSEQTGCRLVLFIEGRTKDLISTPAVVKKKLALLWGDRPHIHQQVYYDWAETEQPEYFSKITLYFDRKISEDHISDFPEIINLLMESLLLVEEINQ